MTRQSEAGAPGLRRVRDSNGAAPRIPTSAVLIGLLGDAGAERVTLEWLIERLGERSFGIVLLLLSLLSMIPGVSIPASLLLLVAAIQMILAHRGPVFPHRLAAYRFRTQQVASMVRKVLPVLKFMERVIRPRWPTPAEMTKRVIGLSVLMLALSMFVPVPFANMPPAIIVVLIAFAYLEEDGLVLSISLAAALVLLAMFAALAWRAASLWT